MQIKKIIYKVFILLFFSLSSVGYTQNYTPDNSELSVLIEQVLELQQQTNEMKNEYEEEIKTLKNKIDKLDQSSSETQKKDINDELSRLRGLAEAEKGKAVEQRTDEETFKSDNLDLQVQNPEISVIGDFLFSYRRDTTSDHNSDFNFRNLGVHIESWLDPYTNFKSAVEFHEDETELGEAYVTLFNLGDDINLTLGKFRQQFGVINRCHKHGLDQVDFPLALREIFGDDGLNQSGISLDWIMPPTGDSSQQLTFQLTDGSNSRVFGENSHNKPSILAHYKNYQDISKDTYMEWGLTSLFGWNDQWSISGGSSQESDKTTAILGADFSVLWEPTEKMRYRNVEWRNEIYWLRKNLLAPDDSGSDTINTWGIYSYIQTKFSRTLDIGLRGDFYVPDTKSYANLSSDLSLSPLAVVSDDPYICQVSPYITLWQSPFVKFRAEYDYSNGKGIENPEHVVWLQVIFTAGSHKHEHH